MRRFLPLLFVLAALGITHHASAQSVSTNLVPTRPGDYTVPSGSIVHVSNTSGGEVTIQVPYEPPVTLKPGETHTMIIKPNPGGSTHVDGPDGAWRFTATSQSGTQQKS